MAAQHLHLGIQKFHELVLEAVIYIVGRNTIQKIRELVFKCEVTTQFHQFGLALQLSLQGAFGIDFDNWHFLEDITHAALRCNPLELLAGLVFELDVILVAQSLLVVEHHEHLLVRRQQIHQHFQRLGFFNSAQRIDHKDDRICLEHLGVGYVFMRNGGVHAGGVENAVFVPGVSRYLVGQGNVIHCGLFPAQQHIDQGAFACVVDAINHDAGIWLALFLFKYVLNWREGCG